MRWLDVLHVLDSSFPTGAYVHSFGLESLSDCARSAAALGEALSLRLAETLGRFELVFVLAAYTHDLVDLDERCHVMQLVRESREASSLIGRNLLRSVCSLIEEPRLLNFAREGRHQHHPVAFGALAAAQEMPPGLAGEAYAFGALRGQVSAAQRLGWLGQRDAQQVLDDLKPRVRAIAQQAAKVSLDEAGAFAPAWDIASMRHERAHSRMFAS
jgi:urease accessory protein